jgi:energy-coupling factor transporter transmembrane protein EcfT
MGELTAIGFAPGRSLLHRLDPRTKQALLLMLSMLGMWGQPAFLTLLTVVVLFLFRTVQVRFFRLVHEVRFFLLFLILIFVVRTVSFDGTWTPVFFSDQAAEALLICWRLLLVVLMGLLLMATTRTAHVRAALVWFLKPVPFINEKMAATMVALVVRFLPQILMQAAEISDAQRARCIERRKHPFYRLKCLSIPLFRRVFLRADELTEAMQARCYNEDRTLPDLSFSSQDVLAAAVACLLALFVLFP